MAKVSEPRLGGLTKEQEREVAAQLERSLGLNPEWGWKRNIPNILGNAYRVYGMTDEEWDKTFRGLPNYGDWQGQDVDAVQERLLNKYPHKKILGFLGLGEKYGGVIPSDAAYQKIMSISPDALSGVKATGLDSYEGPIAETIEYEDPNQQVGPGRVPSFDNTGIYSDDPMFEPRQETLRYERWLREEWVPDASYQELFESGWIEEAQERAEKERRDKRSQQKWDAERRSRQYDAIAKRFGT